MVSRLGSYIALSLSLLVHLALVANTFRRFVSGGVALNFNRSVRMMRPSNTCFDVVGLLRGYLLISLFVLCFQRSSFSPSSSVKPPSWHCPLPLRTALFLVLSVRICQLFHERLMSN